MNRLRNFSQTYAAMLLGLTMGSFAGEALSLLLLVARPLCEPLLPYVLPLITKAIFRTSISYRPDQYYWIAAYLGVFSVSVTLAVSYLILRQPAENARVEAALLRKIGPQEARGAPLEP